VTSGPARHAEVLVLGAGLQGSCVALALAAQGHRVAVLDRAAAPMSGASRNAEGKIHLGYVYALDCTGETQRRMLAGALAFAPLLDRWLGAQPWEKLRSPPFSYAVMPDSLLSADDLETEYACISGAVADVRGSVEDTIGGDASYLGRPLDGRVTRHRSGPATPHIRGAPVVDVFSTEEVAVDPVALSDAVRISLCDQPRIDVRTSSHVVSATRTANGFTIDVVDVGGPAARRPDGRCLFARQQVDVPGQARRRRGAAGRHRPGAHRHDGARTLRRCDRVGTVAGSAFLVSRRAHRDAHDRGDK
jgi:hypothetical protein